MEKREPVSTAAALAEREPVNIAFGEREPITIALGEREAITSLGWEGAYN